MFKDKLEQISFKESKKKVFFQATELSRLLTLGQGIKHYDFCQEKWKLKCFGLQTSFLTISSKQVNLWRQSFSSH